MRLIGKVAGLAKDLFTSPIVRFYCLALALLMYGFGLFMLNVYDCVPVETIKNHFIKNSFIDSLLIMLPSLFLPPKFRTKYLWLSVILLYTWLLAQVLYFRNFGNMLGITLSMIGDNVNWLVVSSSLYLMKLRDLLFVIVPLCAYLVYRKYMRKQVLASPLSVWYKCIYIVLTFTFVAKAYIMPYMFNHKDMTPYENVKFYYEIRFKAYDKFVSFTKYGMWVYLICDYCCKAEHITLTASELKSIADFEAGDDNNNLAVVVPDNSKKNLIFVVVESFNSWSVGLKIDGKSVTPYLDKVLASEGVISCINVLDQVSLGGSSDGHFIYNTGLLPLTNSEVAVMYGSSPFHSISRALPRKNSFEIITDQSSMWNQKNTYKSYGYKRMYDWDNMNDIFKNGDIPIDSRLFAVARKVVTKSSAQPFNAFIVTVGMHKPFFKTDTEKTWISSSNQYTKEVRNYLERVHLFDTEFEKFINHLKAEGLYDNSVVVIASDHSEPIDDVPNGRKSISENGDMCVFAAMNTGVTLRHDAVMGQIDVYPTVLDIMECGSYKWRGVGNSILREQKVESAVSSGGIVYGNKQSRLVARQKEAWNISRLIIMGDYFKNQF